MQNKCLQQVLYSDNSTGRYSYWTNNGDYGEGSYFQSGNSQSGNSNKEANQAMADGNNYASGDGGGAHGFKGKGCNIPIVCLGEANVSKALDSIDESMRGKFNNGVYDMGQGHILNYYEAIWLWRNGGGSPVIVDGNMLYAGYVPIMVTMVLPFPLDSTKVYGHVTVKPGSQETIYGIPIPYTGRIYYDEYDFNKTKPSLFNIGGQIREFLNDAAILEHGSGTPYQLKIKYEY
jgi:hypothetical protein